MDIDAVSLPCSTLSSLAPAGLPMTVLMRSASKADLQDLLELESLFAEPERISRRSWSRFLEDPDTVQVAELDGQLAGAAVLLFRTNSRKARLYSIVTAEAARGRGVARALLEKCEHIAKTRACRSIGLEVHEKNWNAIALYRSAGFDVTGSKPRFYADGGNAIVMRKTLVPAGGGR